jgi:hypothetical protein
MVVVEPRGVETRVLGVVESRVLGAMRFRTISRSLLNEHHCTFVCYLVFVEAADALSCDGGRAHGQGAATKGQMDKRGQKGTNGDKQGQSRDKKGQTGTNRDKKYIFEFP